MQYVFLAALEPGEERKLTVEVIGLFRGQKLFMHGTMGEVRGHFRIKRTCLPLLNRDDVVAYTRIYKRGKFWFSDKTVVEFSGFEGGVREYLPSSVEYIHTDPLEYIRLLNLQVGEEPAMPSFSNGVTALFFGPNRLGNSLPMATTESSMSITLKNDGDISVCVRAVVFGVGLA